MSYRIIERKEREEVLLRVIKQVDSEKLRLAGPENKPNWEKGWSENLQEFKESGNIDSLIPSLSSVRK